MPFLDALTTALGGWSDVKQIDKEGFDFREKRAQEDWMRRRQQELAQQANEDRDIKMAEDVLAGSEDETPDISPFLRSMAPDRQIPALAMLKGRAKERKSALAQQKAYMDSLLLAQRGQQTAAEIGLRGDEAENLVRLRAKLAQERQLSPAEQATLDSLERRAAMMESGREGRFQRGLGMKPQLRQTRDAQGNAVWDWVMPGESAPVAPTAIERQVSGMADTVKGNVQEMEQLAPDVVSGPILGRLSKASQSFFGPHGKEGEFDFDANAVIDTVYVKSGKQINQTEMQILRNMIPDRARGNLPQQVRQFKEYANSLLQKYGGTGGGTAGGSSTPPRPPGVPEGAKFDPVTRRWRL